MDTLYFAPTRAEQLFFRPSILPRRRRGGGRGKARAGARAAIAAGRASGGPRSATCGGRERAQSRRSDIIHHWRIDNVFLIFHECVHSLSRAADLCRCLSRVFGNPQLCARNPLGYERTDVQHPPLRHRQSQRVVLVRAAQLRITEQQRYIVSHNVFTFYALNEIQFQNV